MTMVLGLDQPMVLGLGQPMPSNMQLGGDAAMFMSPELLVPSKFGFTESIPTPEADVYAFGLVIYQVCKHDRGYPSFIYIYQVLTGKLPFPSLRMSDVALNVVQGVRPTKPENASAIRFSDSLWDFVQRCWDGNMELRPKVVEVVSQLKIAVADWDKVVPPCIQVESAFSEPEVAFEMLDPVVEDDHNTQNIRTPPLQGHSSYNAFPQQDFSSASKSHVSLVFV